MGGKVGMHSPRGDVLVASGMSGEDDWYDLITITVAIGDGMAGVAADLVPDGGDWRKAGEILQAAGYDPLGEPYWETRHRLWLWLLLRVRTQAPRPLPLSDRGAWASRGPLKAR